MVYEGERYEMGYFESERKAAQAVNAKCRELGLEARNPSVKNKRTPKQEPCSECSTSGRNTFMCATCLSKFVD